MTIKDVEKSCNCKYAKAQKSFYVHNGWYILCRKRIGMTDPEYCAKCKEREENDRARKID